MYAYKRASIMMIQLKLLLCKIEVPVVKNRDQYLIANLLYFCFIMVIIYSVNRIIACLYEIHR